MRCRPSRPPGARTVACASAQERSLSYPFSRTVRRCFYDASNGRSRPAAVRRPGNPGPRSGDGAGQPIGRGPKGRNATSACVAAGERAPRSPTWLRKCQTGAYRLQLVSKDDRGCLFFRPRGGLPCLRGSGRHTASQGQGASCRLQPKHALGGHVPTLLRPSRLRHSLSRAKGRRPGPVRADDARSSSVYTRRMTEGEVGSHEFRAEIVDDPTPEENSVGFKYLSWASNSTRGGRT